MGGACAYIGDRRGAEIILVGRPEGKSLRGTPKGRNGSSRTGLGACTALICFWNGTGAGRL